LTASRYNAYRRVQAELDRFSSEALAESEKELLRDAAEGLLLARDDSQDEVQEMRSKTAMALSLLVGLGRWSDAAADQMWLYVMACGPLDSRSPREPARAVQHA
jgi:hypothetical protein